MALRDFGNAEQDILRDQIVEKAYNERICERLLLDDKVALDKAIHIANQVESTACDANTFSNSDVPVWEISKLLKGGGGCSNSSGGQKKGGAKSAHTSANVSDGKFYKMPGYNQNILWKNGTFRRSVSHRSKT